MTPTRGLFSRQHGLWYVALGLALSFMLIKPVHAMHMDPYYKAHMHNPVYYCDQFGHYTYWHKRYCQCKCPHAKHSCYRYHKKSCCKHVYVKYHCTSHPYACRR